MKNIKSGIVLIVLIIAASVKSFSQNNDRTLLRQVVRENQDAVNAIAMYPTETRKIIFLACEYPEVISKLNAMQKSTQQAFEKLVSVYGKEEQRRYGT